jgi:site-specific DNA recombinase
MTTNDLKTKYALYCRKSTEDNNRQVLSLDSQEQEMKRLAINLGIQVIQVFRESKSAKKPDNRPLFNELVEMIKAGKIEGVLCWKIDRLSRNPIDSATIQWLLQQDQLKAIQTMERQYLPSDNTLLFNVESGMANQYILDLSKNVKRGLRAKLEQGYWPNRAPIGYLNKDSKTIIDESKVCYIKKIFELYATGKYSVKEITDTIYKEGFRSTNGTKYNKSKIHKMLGMSFYCGIMEKDNKKYLGKYEPIISKKLFDEVQEVIKNRSHIKRQVLPFAFRGILKCANCGCQLTATKKREKHIYYYCTNGKGTCSEHKTYLKEEDLSKSFEQVFIPLLFDEKLIELIYKAKLQEQKQSHSYLDNATVGLHSRLKNLEYRKNMLLDAYLDKLITEDDFRAKKDSLDNEMIEIAKELEELESRKVITDKITLERIKNVFLGPKNIRKSFLKANPEKQKEILNSLLWNAEISNKKIAKVSYKQPYDILSKIENKSDFILMRRERDSNPRYA